MNLQQQCEALYMESFSPDEEFDRQLFESFFDCCRYLIRDKKVVTMLFALPCVCHLGPESIPSYYLYAVATKKEYRYQGLMRELLNLVADEGKLCVLKPSGADTQRAYQKCGFHAFDAVRSIKGNKKMLVSKQFSNLADFCPQNGEEYTAMYRFEKELDLNGLAFPYVME